MFLRFLPEDCAYLRGAIPATKISDVDSRTRRHDPRHRCGLRRRPRRIQRRICLRLQPVAMVQYAARSVQGGRRQSVDRAYLGVHRTQSRCVEKAPVTVQQRSHASRRTRNGIWIFGCAPNPPVFLTRQDTACADQAGESTPLAPAEAEVVRARRIAVRSQSAQRYPEARCCRSLLYT